jgi:hypothetical protein
MSMHTAERSTKELVKDRWLKNNGNVFFGMIPSFKHANTTFSDRAVAGRTLVHFDRSASIEMGRTLAILEDE